MEHAEEPLMPSGGEFVEGFDKVMAGWFQDIELVFEVQQPIFECPIFFGHLENPGFSLFIIHSSEGLDYDWVRC